MPLSVCFSFASFGRSSFFSKQSTIVARVVPNSASAPLTPNPLAPLSEFVLRCDAATNEYSNLLRHREATPPELAPRIQKVPELNEVCFYEAVLHEAKGALVVGGDVFELHAIRFYYVAILSLIHI